MWGRGRRGRNRQFAPHWIQDSVESGLHPQDFVPVPLILTQLRLMKQTCNQPHKQQEADKDVFLSQRRSVPFLLHEEVPTPHFSNRMGNHHTECGGGRKRAAVRVHWRCTYKLGITLVIVHLVEALEHILLMTCKRNESMQRQVR